MTHVAYYEPLGLICEPKGMILVADGKCGFGIEEPERVLFECQMDGFASLDLLLGRGDHFEDLLIQLESNNLVRSLRFSDQTFR